MTDAAPRPGSAPAKRDGHLIKSLGDGAMLADQIDPELVRRGPE